MKCFVRTSCENKNKNYIDLFQSHWPISKSSSDQNRKEGNGQFEKKTERKKKNYFTHANIIAHSKKYKILTDEPPTVFCSLLGALLRTNKFTRYLQICRYAYGR